MLHINNTEKKIKVRLSRRNTASRFEWKTIYPGQTVRMTPQEGKAYGLYLCENSGEESKESKNKVESNEDYFKRLVDIKGIGKKTAEKVVSAYPNQEKLIKALEEEEMDLQSNMINLLVKEFLN